MEIAKRTLNILLESLEFTKRAKLENLEQLRIVKNDLMIDKSSIPEATRLQQTTEQLVSDLHILDKLIEDVKSDYSTNYKGRDITS